MVTDDGRSGTELQRARAGETTEAMRVVAAREGLEPTTVRDEVAAGRMVIPANGRHRAGALEPMAIGAEAAVKVNANLGASASTSGPDGELDKLATALRWGADTVMDLSTGRDDLAAIRRRFVEHSPVPVGTVPIYEMVDRVDGDVASITPELALDVIEDHAEQGVDYMTIHAGVLRDHVPLTDGRVTGIVSRGGSIVAQWMREHERENFLFERFDAICDVFREHDVTFSLGDGLRPGSIADASDHAQFAELETLGDLTRRAWDAGCQVMVEGPGHVPLDEVAHQVERQKRVCDGAPFYTLGPLVTDAAPGYDHVTSAIGAAVIGWHGADMLCYVTPKEHLGLPDEDDVREGLMAYNVAAHAADVARGRDEARAWDRALSEARFAFDWERQLDLAMDPDRARAYHQDANSEENHDPEAVEFCSMCGPEFCSMRITQDARRAADEDALASDASLELSPSEHRERQGARYPGEASIVRNGTAE